MTAHARLRSIAAGIAVVLALAIVPAAASADEGEPAPSPTTSEPAPEPTPTEQPRAVYGCYVLPWSSTIRVAWSTGEIQKTSKGLSCTKAGVPITTPKITYAKVSWAPARYALVNYRHAADDAEVDEVVLMTASKLRAAGSPTIKKVAHVPTSVYYRYASSSVDRYVRTPDGTRHKLTDAQYEKAGRPALKKVYGGYYRTKWSKDVYLVSSSGAKKKLSAAKYEAAGSPRVAVAPTVYVKTAYSPVHALVTWPHKKNDTAVDQVVLLTDAQYKKAGKPKPEVRARIPGDSFVRLTIGKTIYHRSQGYLTPVTKTQWKAAGSPTIKTVKPSKPMYIRGVLIVNKSLALPSSYGSGLTKTLRTSFADMKKAAARDGVNLHIISGFRSYASQKSVHAAKIRQYGYATAQLRSARPGHSEHQTGLAIDVNSISQAWGETRAGRWVAKHAHKYGFIVRYPKGKTSVTGFAYEPWHLRYVGVDVAKQLRKTGLTLDEYLGVPSKY